MRLLPGRPDGYSQGPSAVALLVDAVEYMRGMVGGAVGFGPESPEGGCAYHVKPCMCFGC